MFFLSQVKLFLITTINNFLKLFGLKILKTSSLNNIEKLNSKLLNQLSLSFESNLKAGISSIVFSKDRAMQLNLFLESHKENINRSYPIFIIYSYTNDKHLESYRKLQEEKKNKFSNLFFINEKKYNNFKECLILTLESIKTKNLIFFVDDIVFINKINFDIAAELDTKSTILSLRLHPNLKRSYTANKKIKPPNFTQYRKDDELIKFAWYEQECEWSCPWSVDGHVLSLSEVYYIAKNSNFFAPNSFEGVFFNFNYLAKNKTGICFEESKVFNLTINKVQNENSNKSGNISVSYLLEKWDKNLAINYSDFKGFKSESTHEVKAISFIKRNL